MNTQTFKQDSAGMKGILLLLLLMVLLLSCQSVQPEREWKGEMTSHEWTLKILEKNNAVLQLPFPGLVEIMGEAYKEDNDNWVFYADSLHLFYNWHDGWTDSEIAMKGILRLQGNGDNTWTAVVIETPLMESATRAEIRYRRTMMTGDRAVDFMNRRLARTRSVTDFITTEMKIPDYHFNHRKKGLFSKEFDHDLKRLLFPEVYGFSEDYPRPPVLENQKDRFDKQEEIPWDTQYTAEYFPEELIDVRNSGTLFRDFEEASDLIYINCLWQELWGVIVPESAIREF